MQSPAATLEPSVVGVRIEEHGEDIMLRRAGTHEFLCRTEHSGDNSAPDATTWQESPHPELSRFRFGADAAIGDSSIPPAIAWVTNAENFDGDALSGPVLADLLQYDNQHLLGLFWELLAFIDRASLIALVPLLADQPAYPVIFSRLQKLLGKGDGVFPLNTRAQLHAEIARFGWSIGDHTYGRPMIVDEQSAMLTIGRFGSIAAFSTIVLGNHTMSTATTYPFALLAGYWPQALAGIGLVDHTGRDVIIGHDVWIGISAIILPGTRIGHGAIIAANAVARGDIPPYAVIAGNPGKIIKYRFTPDIIARLLKVAWWDWPDDKVDRFIPLLLAPDITLFLEAAESGTRIVRPDLPNIALGRPCRQSSMFPWSKTASVEADAMGLVNGHLTGGYQCHTDMENDPWWEVDLGPAARVHEIRIYNRMDTNTARRAIALSILSSLDGTSWHELHRHTDIQPFGGIDGRPLTWRSENFPEAARFLRIKLHGFTCLHFDQVEVFGLPESSTH